MAGQWTETEPNLCYEYKNENTVTKLETPFKTGCEWHISITTEDKDAGTLQYHCYLIRQCNIQEAKAEAMRVTKRYIEEQIAYWRKLQSQLPNEDHV